MSSLQGGLEGVADLIKDVHLLKVNLEKSVVRVLPQFIRNTQKNLKKLQLEKAS
jgi:hypothetical protein